MSTLTRLILIAVALIHLAPVIGVLGGGRLALLYGITPGDSTLSILLRHRALLFAIPGLLLVGAAFHAPWRVPALAASLLSLVGFLLIVHLEGGGNAALQRLARIDLVALLGLLLVLGHDVAVHGRSGSA